MKKAAIVLGILALLAWGWKVALTMDAVTYGVSVISLAIVRYRPQPRATQDVSLDGYWQDIGTLEQYLQANVDALDERVQLSIPDRKSTRLNSSHRT